MIKRLLFAIIALIILSISSLLIWQLPVKKKMHFKNCEVAYDYFHDGYGFEYVIFGGPGESYPNVFWFNRAKIELLKCLCVEYERKKDSQIEKFIVDSIKNDNELIARYIVVGSGDSYLQFILDSFDDYEMENISEDSINSLYKNYTKSLKIGYIPKFSYEILTKKLFNFLRKNKNFQINIDSVCKHKAFVLQGYEIQ